MLEDTNDIGFQAVEVKDGFGLAPGVWFKLCLGGITGHFDFARDTGVLVRPQDACKVADAVVRVFVEHGNRTDRTKARMKYVLDAIGIEKYVALTEEKFGRKFDRAVPGAVAERPAFSRTAHIGVHAQKQDGLNWIGVVVPVGKLTVAQMRGLARIARELGDGDIRLTVWQNLLHLRRADGEGRRRLRAHRRARARDRHQRHPRRARSPAPAIPAANSPPPTPSGTPRTSRSWCEARVALDAPVNIHLTGCHHSCAQHCISEIGLLACKVQATEDGDPVEGYHVLIGGGFGPDAAIGRELYRDVDAEEAPRTVERILKAYLAHRASNEESFLAFARRHEIDALKAMTELEAAE